MSEELRPAEIIAVKGDPSKDMNLQRMSNANFLRYSVFLVEIQNMNIAC